MNQDKPLTVAAIGLDHRHIFGQLDGMLAAGARCKAWWTAEDTNIIPGFQKRFRDVPRETDLQRLIDDPEIDMALIAAIPKDRADLAIRFMEAGKDVMTDKPGCTDLEQLARLEECAARTGRIWSVDFSERFEVPAVAVATDLVRAGEIGEVVQTVGLGPHRLNRDLRPDWFFEPKEFGGIICDIASHQIDQFLFFTGSDDATIVASSVGNFANPGDARFEDFGEVLLRSEKGTGYIRVDWYTPDALPNWGDGRLTLLGTKGTIELRKYVDVAGREGTDHVFLVNETRCEYIDASAVPLTYFERLAHDVRHRTETATPQKHTFKVMELAIKAQAQAARLGHLA